MSDMTEAAGAFSFFKWRVAKSKTRNLKSYVWDAGWGKYTNLFIHQDAGSGR